MLKLNENSTMWDKTFIILLSKLAIASRHTVMQENEKRHMAHKYIISGTVKSPNSAFCISKTTQLISTQYAHIYTTSHIKIKGAFLEISIPVNYPTYFTFYFFAQNYKYI